MIECKTCKLLKDEENFSFRNKARQLRHANCKECVRKFSMEWYHNNKARHAETSKASGKRWRAKLKAESVRIVNTIKSAPCCDCKGLFNPWQMQFDHLDPSTKKFNVATAVHFSHQFRLPEILEEISKCQLVCANCHANRTYYRRMNP